MTRDERTAGRDRSTAEASALWVHGAELAISLATLRRNREAMDAALAERKADGSERGA